MAIVRVISGSKKLAKKNRTNKAVIVVSTPRKISIRLSRCPLNVEYIETNNGLPEATGSALLLRLN